MSPIRLPQRPTARPAARVFLFFASVCLMACTIASSLQAGEVENALQKVNSLGPAGEGFESAMQAAAELRELDPQVLPTVLNATRESSPVAQNWLRGIARDIVRDAHQPAVDLLVAYAADVNNVPVGRAIAVDLISESDPELALTLIRGGLNDPSLLIREKAVADAMQTARALKSDNQTEAIEKYRETLTAARHPKQLADIITALNDLGETVTTADAFSMVGSWQSVAPFDNVDGVGFDRLYPPEADFVDDGTIDFSETYQGKHGDVQWQAISGDTKDGKVDLANAYNKEKGAVAYLYTEFSSAQQQDAQIRLGCINANKVWLNGKEVMSNEVYHSGSMIDQYIASVSLNKGINRVLLKICQNEQTESWAQEWEFQFRFTDLTGKGLLSKP